MRGQKNWSPGCFAQILFNGILTGLPIASKELLSPDNQNSHNRHVPSQPSFE